MSDEKEFFVAGVQHHDLAQVVNELEVGDDLELIPEPTNKYDPNAIQIKDCLGTMLGYVPRKFSAEISAKLELTELVCTITELNKENKPWEMLKVKIVPLAEIKEEDEDERCPQCGEILDECVCIEEE